MSPDSPFPRGPAAARWDIVGLGVCTIDILIRVPELPSSEGVQRASQTCLQGGGPVATALAAAARLGAKTLMLDRQGDDWRGDLIRNGLEELGVMTDLCERVPGASSALASIWVRERDGARTIAYDPGSLDPLQPADLPTGVIEQARILHTNGRHQPAWFAAARRARDAGVAVSFDGGANRFRPEMREYLPWIDLAIVSLDWAERFSGCPDPIEAGKRIRAAGPSLVAVTDGTRGSWVAHEDSWFHQPAFRVPDTIDTTGCGDVYHGAFLAGWAWGWSLERCAQIASAAAAINSRAMGGRGCLPSLTEAETFLRQAR